MSIKEKNSPLGRSLAKRKRASLSSAISVKKREAGSWSEIVAASCQVLLIGLAIWGLLFSSIGDKVIGNLRTDVQESRRQLVDLREQRNYLDQAVRTQQASMYSAQGALVDSKTKLAGLSIERAIAANALKSTNGKLENEIKKLDKLSEAYRLAKPGIESLPCRRLHLYLSYAIAKINLGPALAEYRWRRFRLEQNVDNQTDWKKVETEFLAWSLHDESSSSFSGIKIHSADQVIDDSLSEQVYWQSNPALQAKRRLGDLVKVHPGELMFPLGLSGSASIGSLSSIEKFNPWTGLLAIFDDDAISKIDDEHARWLRSKRELLLQYREALDYNSPTAIGSDENYSMQVADLMVRYLRMLHQVDDAMDGICKS